MAKVRRSSFAPFAALVSSSVRIPDVVKSRPLRLALFFAIALTATVTAIFALLDRQVLLANQEQIKGLLRAEALSAVKTSVDELRLQLDLRLTRDLRRLDFVGLFDQKGRLIYGNFKGSIPVPADGEPRLARSLSSETPQVDEPVMFVALQRTDGGTLLLGRSLVGVYRLRTAMEDSYRTAIGPLILASLLLGLLLGFRETRRLREIRRAIKQVMAGDISARLPPDRRKDDIGAVVRAVNGMLDALERLLRQFKEVGDNVAHDLRSPLAALHTRLEQALQDDNQAGYRHVIVDGLSELDRALRASNAVLRLAELQAGFLPAAFGDVDLVAICRDVMDLFSPVADEQGIRMVLRAPLTSIMRGDFELLQEVIVNLLDNAIKYSHPGGTIEMRVGTDGAVFQIADSGPGIPDVRRETIFRRFHRLDGSRHIPGTGLGLSIAAAIVEIHGLALRVVEGTETGATFEIR